MSDHTDPAPTAEKDRIANICCGHAACQREARALMAQAQAEALNEAATALLTVSPHNPNTGMDSVVAAWLQGRAARAKEDE